MVAKRRGKSLMYNECKCSVFQDKELSSTN